MWRISLFFNWVRVCIRFKTLAPWSTRFVNLKPMTEADIKWIKEHVPTIPLELKPREKIRVIAQGLRKNGLSYREIAERLNDKGYRNAIGNLFTHGNAWTLLGGGKPEEVKP